MVRYNLIVPYESLNDVLDLQSEDFRVDNYAYRNRQDMSVIIAESSEETFMYFKLKYGQQNVWKR